MHDMCIFKSSSTSSRTLITTCNEGKLTESFDVKIGVKQGCLLYPFLFLLAIDYIMRESTEGGKKTESNGQCGNNWMT